MLSRIRRAIGRMAAPAASHMAEAITRYPHLPGCWSQSDDVRQLWGFVALRVSLPPNLDQTNKLLRELTRLPVASLRIGTYSQAISPETLDAWTATQHAGRPLAEALVKSRRDFLSGAGLRSRLGFLVVQSPLSSGLEAEPQLYALNRQLTGLMQAFGARWTPIDDDNDMFTFKDVHPKQKDEYADYLMTGTRQSPLGLHTALKELDASKFGPSTLKTVLTLIPGMSPEQGPRVQCVVRLHDSPTELPRAKQYFEGLVRKQGLTCKPLEVVARPLWLNPRKAEAWPACSIDELSSLAPIQERVSCQKLSGGGMPLITSAGEARSFNPFRSEGTYNTLICGNAGTGKHFIASELLTRHIMQGDGGMAWVLDSSGSYARLADALGANVVTPSPQDTVQDLLALVSSKETWEAHQGLFVQWLCLLANVDVPTHSKRLWDAVTQASAVSETLSLGAVSLALLASTDPVTKKLGETLAAVAEERVFQANKPIPYAPLTVFDLSLLDRTRQALIGQTLLLQIKLLWMQTSTLTQTKKLVLVDNPTLVPNQELLEQVLRACRRYNGGVLLISNLADVIPGGRWDSALMFVNYVLMQYSSPEDIERYIKHVRLPEEHTHSLRRLNNSAADGRQSELMLHDRQYGECARFSFRVDKLSQTLYNTRSRHKATYSLLRAEGASPLKALEACQH